MRTLASNSSYRPDSVSIFEIGRIYLRRDKDLPSEPGIAAGLFYGSRFEEGWLGSEGQYDFYDAKGVVEALMREVGVAADFQPSDDPFFHPGKAASILANGLSVGILGEVNPLVQESFEIDGGSVVFFELDLEKLLEAIPKKRRVLKPLARYPRSIRDISILVDSSIPAARIQSVIENQPLVERALLFDAYEGKEVPLGKSSLAYRLYFQASDRTLSSEEVNKSLAKVLGVLELKVGISLRGREEVHG